METLEEVEAALIERVPLWNDRTKEHGPFDIIGDVHGWAAENNPRAAWIDTDDLNGPNNALHYGKDGYQKLGRQFAAKAIELIKASAGRPMP